MRAVLGIGMVLALAVGTAAGADEKFDAKKLVGTWAPVNPKKGEGMTLEFSKDGKLTVTGAAEGKDLKLEGTYKLEGDKLTFAIKFMDTEIKDTVTLTKLTDEEMSGKDKDGKEESFKKVKAKPEKK